MLKSCKLLLMICCMLSIGYAGVVFALDSEDQATLDRLEAEIQGLKSQVDQLRKDLDTTKQDLETTKQDLEAAKQEQKSSLLFKTPDNKPTTQTSASHVGQEKCKVVDSHGNGMIKPYMADSGGNLDGDANAWIWVPYGQCKKINKGDFSGVPVSVRNKINESNITYSPSSK